MLKSVTGDNLNKRHILDNSVDTFIPYGYKEVNISTIDLHGISTKAYGYHTM